MTAHDLAIQAIDAALTDARELVRELESAKTLAAARCYARARSRLSDAVSSASTLDVIRLANAGRALDGCR